MRTTTTPFRVSDERLQVQSLRPTRPGIAARRVKTRCIMTHAPLLASLRKVC